jgi:hypothetical protein
MALLADYALTPDVFDVTSYSSDEVCGLHLAAIREVLLTEGLVRDLRAGEWRGLFANDGRPWHRRGKELVKKLATQGRLIQLPAALPAAPADDCAWCAEALATHGVHPFKGGVIVTPPVKEAYVPEPLVASIDQLRATPWWTGRSESARLMRSLAAYQEHLDPILRCANSLQFIDPHLDPRRHQYREFGHLLVGAGRRTPAPLIEIHRVCYEGSGPTRRILDPAELERVFRDGLTAPLRAVGLEAEVFVWDDFRDRYLLSNLIGITLPNGFDTTRNPRDITTWTRLGRTERDDIQREFEEASRRHALRGRFRIP